MRKAILIIEPSIEQRVRMIRCLSGKFCVLSAANVEEGLEIDFLAGIAVCSIHLTGTQNESIAQYARVHEHFRGSCALIAVSDCDSADFECAIRRIGVSYYTPDSNDFSDILSAINSLGAAGIAPADETVDRLLNNNSEECCIHAVQGRV